MIFGQLSNRESLRDLIVAMEAHAGKLYHLGIGKSVTRSNLSKANEQRDSRIFEEYATFMIAEARRRRIYKIFELDGHAYAFDSTTIDLCLSVFEWAKFRKHKGGIKLHTLYDIEAEVPAFVHILCPGTHFCHSGPKVRCRHFEQTDIVAIFAVQQQMSDIAMTDGKQAFRASDSGAGNIMR